MHCRGLSLCKINACLVLLTFTFCALDYIKGKCPGCCCVVNIMLPLTFSHPMLCCCLSKVVKVFSGSSKEKFSLSRGTVFLEPNNVSVTF